MRHKRFSFFFSFLSFPTCMYRPGDAGLGTKGLQRSACACRFNMPAYNTKGPRRLLTKKKHLLERFCHVLRHNHTTKPLENNAAGVEKERKERNGHVLGVPLLRTRVALTPDQRHRCSSHASGASPELPLPNPLRRIMVSRGPPRGIASLVKCQVDAHLLLARRGSPSRVHTRRVERLHFHALPFTRPKIFIVGHRFPLRGHACASPPSSGSRYIPSPTA